MIANRVSYTFSYSTRSSQLVLGRVNSEATNQVHDFVELFLKNDLLLLLLLLL